MKTKHAARLRAFGFWGKAREAIMIPLDPKAATVCVNLLRIPDSDGKVIKTRPRTRRVYNESTNQKAAWRTLKGDKSYFEEYPRPFPQDAPGLGWSDGRPDKENLHESQSFQVLANRAWCLSAFIEVPGKGQKHRLWVTRWARFSFRIFDGKTELLFHSKAWTQSAEDAVNALLVKADRTSGEDAALESQSSAIYLQTESVDLGGDSYFYGRNGFELSFIPDPAGFVQIEASNGLSADVSISEFKNAVSDSLKPATMWPTTTVFVGSNGGFHIWAVGDVVEEGAGRLEWLLTKPTDDNDDLDDLQFDFNKCLPNGSTISFRHESAGPGVSSAYFKVIADFTGPAWLYGSARAFLDAGEREGSTEVAWDSDQHKRGNKTIIYDVRPQWTEEGRRCAEIEIEDMKGQSLLNHATGMPLLHYHVLENRVATLDIDGEPFITNGLITTADPRSMAGMTPNTTPDKVSRWNTRITLYLCDQWARVDEAKVRSQPIGDGKKLGTYCESLFKIAGVKDEEINSAAATSPIRGVPPGEDWKETPGFGSSVGTAITDTTERHGLGARWVHGRNGIWEPITPPNNVVAAFHSANSLHDPNTDAGRLHVLGPLDWKRSFEEFYNDWSIFGANGSSYRWRENGSISNFFDLRIIGRSRLADFVTDDSLKTQGELARAARTRRELDFLPGHFAGVTTYYHNWISLWDLITIDGMMCRIEAINDGSIRADRMQLWVRRLS